MSDDDRWDTETSLGLTALIVAAGRAVDTHRPDGLIHDPWAEHFVAAAHPAVPLPVRPVPPRDDSEEETWQMMSGYMGVRTRWFDQFFVDATNAGIRQVVILAAGLDCRAYRLPWPDGTRVFEVDRAGVLEFKTRVLAARSAEATCSRHGVGADLREDWPSALLAAGFDPERPSAWLAEGLLPYLPAAAETALLDAVDRLSAPGSAFAIENFTNLTAQAQDPVFRRISLRLGVDMLALLHEDDRDDPERELTRRGWEVDCTLAADAAADYGRTLDPLTQRLSAKSLLLRATC